MKKREVMVCFMDTFWTECLTILGVVGEKGTPGTVKQIFNLTILIENKCVKKKVGTMSQVSKLLAVQENLSKEMDEMRVIIAAKDTEILKLKLKNQQLSSEGPGVTEALNTENADLKKKVSILTDEIQSLNAEVIW